MDRGRLDGSSALYSSRISRISGEGVETAENASSKLTFVFGCQAVHTADQCLFKQDGKSRLLRNGVRTVLVEDASRFARELVTQELGIIALIRRGVRVFTATGDDPTDSSDPSRKMMRQIAGSFAEYEKARLVSKLHAARERKRTASGKCEGRSC